MDASKTVSSANLPAVLASLPLGQQYELLKSVSGELVAVQTTNNTNKVEVIDRSLLLLSSFLLGS